MKNAISPKRPSFMNSDTKTCQNCHNTFQIEPEDVAFYEKVKTPPPTFCPKCRLQRRLAWFQLFNLYKRPCDLCKKDFISIFQKDAPYIVYCPTCWWSDKWDDTKYGREYDFSRTFFEQFNDLLHEAPILGLSVDTFSLATSPYNSNVGNLKDCYFLILANYNERCGYGYLVGFCNSTYDSSVIHECEACFDTIHGYKNYKCIGANHTTNSIECIFTRDCINCQNCFASANLRNKQYHIFNKPFSKEDYFNETKKWNLGSYTTYKELEKKAHDHWKQYPPKPIWNEFNVNCTGNYVFESKNCKECYEVSRAENSKYLQILNDLTPITECYDVTCWGETLSLSYEGATIGGQATGLKFCHETGLDTHNLEYCEGVVSNSNHCFGCVSMKHTEYAILNKKYSKEEYENLREKIIKHMGDMPYKNNQGIFYRCGEFFPTEMSMQGYNKTLAQNFFPLVKSEIKKLGYKYVEETKSEYTSTTKGTELPDHIKDASSSIVNEVIECTKCKRGFRMIERELAFLKEMNLPLPRECPQCRIQLKFNQWVKNLQLTKRICDKCSIQFETPHTEDRAPIIWCPKCYQLEVA